MSKIIGIDLGTTNSCVSVLEGGEPKVIPNPEGNGQHHLLLHLKTENVKLGKLPNDKQLQTLIQLCRLNVIWEQIIK